MGWKAVLGLLALFLLEGVQACTVFKIGSAGFASSARSLLATYGMFAGNGTFFVDASWFAYKCGKFGEYEGGWHDFFNTSAVVPWDRKAEEAEPDTPCAWHSQSDLDEHVDGLGLGRNSLEAEAIVPLWQLQPRVQSAVDKELARLRTAQKPTIAIHVRGGDKLAEDNNGNRRSTWAFDYIKAIAKTFPEIKGGTCIILGDEHNFVLEAMQIASKVLGCKPFQRPQGHAKEKGHKQLAFNQMSGQERCSKTIELIKDLELLAHADYFAGTYNSGISHLVDKLRYRLYGKSRESIVDASGSEGDFYSQSRHFLHSDRQSRGVSEPPTHPHLVAAEEVHKRQVAQKEALRAARAAEEKADYKVWAEAEERKRAIEDAESAAARAKLLTLR